MMEEEFKVVKRKKKKGKTSKLFRQTNNDGKPLTSCVEDEVDVEKVMSRLDVCRKELEGSCFWNNLKELVARAVQLGTNSYKIKNATNCFHIKKATPNIKDAIGPTNTAEDSCGVINQHKIDHISADDVSLDCKLKRTEVEDKSEDEMNDCATKIDSIVCYGLGNFVSCINARYQLSLLLLIVHHFKIPPSMCYCYDPVFTNTERSILTQYGLSCLELNEEGKRRVEKLTFFYMPHCGKPLYNNLLWSNWGNSLANLLIFGNSFKNIEERRPLLRGNLQRSLTIPT
ncbi:uncharacterized protein [Antedon mediterranea]|uniref:uncharacterized protein isoform X2 n=1 Tax=Antedon mediterranea TaxID=105859 RepID=UPI003AF8D317